MYEFCLNSFKSSPPTPRRLFPSPPRIPPDLIFEMMIITSFSDKMKVENPTPTNFD